MSSSDPLVLSASSDDGPVKFLPDLAEAHRPGAFSGDDDIVPGIREAFPGLSKVLAHHTLYAIANNRVPHLAADGDPKAPASELIVGEIDDEVRRSQAGANRRGTFELAAQEQPLIFGKAPPLLHSRGRSIPPRPIAVSTSWRHER